MSRLYPPPPNKVNKIKIQLHVQHPNFQYYTLISICLKGASHIQNGARPTSLRAKKGIFARKTAGVCSITAGSAAIFRDRPAFAGHRNLFLIQRFSIGDF